METWIRASRWCWARQKWKGRALLTLGPASVLIMMAHNTSPWWLIRWKGIAIHFKIRTQLVQSISKSDQMISAASVENYCQVMVIKGSVCKLCNIRCCIFPLHDVCCNVVCTIAVFAYYANCTFSTFFHNFFRVFHSTCCRRGPQRGVAEMIFLFRSCFRSSLF